MEGRVHPETRIGHIHLKVANIERALVFYRDLLGFEITQWYGEDAVFLSAGGYHHHLGTNTWAAGAPAASDADARLLDWEIVVPDAGDAAQAGASLQAAGYDAAPADGGAWRATDPWGTAVRITSGQ